MKTIEEYFREENMKKALQAMILSIALFLWASPQAELQSLRGTTIGDDSVPAEVLRYIDDDRPMKRDFVQQPPLIPHSIDGYRVDLRHNKCLSCHSWANYEKKKAIKISITHFRDREGNELADVATTRYFCLQCHVPQTPGEALVKNRFLPVKALESRE
uniref:Periplasmic nitrate reductase, electron transfer subunit n=1 Tax=Candidatus Kentrum sp. LPFa TaxID=2126335 RepID=A0A450WM63_9GAMM|nr:MAG: periplasmic nitrate reductase subunit NapB [Candidatus Kentron sp. LPFa]VFK32988.1 MAG: periplasmic nitrate reductase subunit NapB [Candidatus Kentron sp. LPFa]